MSASLRAARSAVIFTLMLPMLLGAALVPPDAAATAAAMDARTHGPAPAAEGSARRATAPQQESTWPAVVDALEGEWDGSGTLFGSPASFTMSWQRSLGDRFLRLVFSNALTTDDGPSPVLSAEAFYRPDDEGGLAGYWFDTRGETVTLRARVTDDRVVTDWQASSESGRTTYLVVDADTLEVIDEVRGADGWQEFGRATYTRRR